MSGSGSRQGTRKFPQSGKKTAQPSPQASPAQPGAATGAAAGWSAEAILSGLATTYLASELYLFASTTSTNDLAIHHGLRGGREGAVFLADTQSSGRGRSGRVWCSPPGCGIYCSALLAPSPRAEQIGLLSIMTGVALVEGIAACGVFRVGLKWPNDLILDGRKVGGILCELQQGVEQARFVVLGFGINVTPPDTPWPDEVQGQATALCADGRPTVSRLEVLRACLRRLDSWYCRYRCGDVDGIIPAWKRAAAILGQAVEVRCAGKVSRSIARDIDDSGALLLESPDGAIQRLVAGDVESASFLARQETPEGLPHHVGHRGAR